MGQRHEITEPATRFIKTIVKHLLPTKFMSIRSYGFYNKPSKFPEDINWLIPRQTIPQRREFITGKLLVAKFRDIPILCRKCGILMEYSFAVT